MWDILRESTVGEIVNYFSGGRILPYPDQRTDYVIPERYLASSPLSGDTTRETRAGDADSKPGENIEDSKNIRGDRPISSMSHDVPTRITSLAVDDTSKKANWTSDAPTRIPSSEAITTQTGKREPAPSGRAAKELEAGNVDEEMAAYDVEGHPHELEKALETAKIGDYVLVDWYGEDDPENPRNWSSRKRGFVLFQICLLT